MKITLITLLLGITTASIAQESAPKAQSKFTFGWFYSPEVSYRILSEGSEADDMTASEIDYRNDNEQAKFGQTFSFFAGYKLSERFTLEGGLGYSDFGQARAPIDVNIGWPSEEPYATIKQSDHLHVINMPLSLHVHLGGNRVQGFISAGVSPGYMSRYTNYRTTDYADGSKITSNIYNIQDQEEFNEFILGVHFSGGIDIRYTDKSSLRIAPVFRYVANNALKPEAIKVNYFNVGIEFGAIYNL